LPKANSIILNFDFCIMHKIYTGLVLKRISYKEADEVVSFWSWEEGKVRILARGAKRSTSKLKAILQPLAWLAVTAVKSDFLPVLTSVRRIASYPALAKRLDLTAGVFNLFEMVLRSTPDRQSNETVSVLLRESLEHLNREKNFSLDFLNLFILRLLAALGYRQSWKNCSQCGSKTIDRGEIFFSRLSFGAVCGRCGRVDFLAEKVDLRVKEYLVKLEKDGLAFKDGALGSKVSSLAEHFLSDVFNSVTERQLNSKKFLKEQLVTYA